MSAYESLLSMAGNAAVHVQDCLLIDGAADSIVLQAQIGPLPSTWEAAKTCTRGVRHTNHVKTWKEAGKMPGEEVESRHSARCCRVLAKEGHARKDHACMLLPSRNSSPESPWIAGQICAGLIRGFAWPCATAADHHQSILRREYGSGTGCGWM